MRRSFNLGKVPSFQKIVISSFVIHLVFIAVTAVPLVHKKREIKPYYVNLVKTAAVHRPETVSDIKNNTPVVEKKVEERTKKIPIEKNIKKKTKAKMSMDPTKKVSKPIDDNKEQKREKARKLAEIKANAKKEAEDALAASNLYAGMGSDDAWDKYRNSIEDIIYSYWQPEGTNIEDIEAVFDIMVDKKLQIASFKIMKSSGNKLFDRSVYKAMSDAREGTKKSPLPEPPPDRREEVEDGFIFTFRYEK